MKPTQIRGSVLKRARWHDSPWHGDGISSAAAVPRSSEGSEGRGQGGRSVSECVCSAWGGGTLPGPLKRPAGESQSLCRSLRPSQPCREINT